MNADITTFEAIIRNNDDQRPQLKVAEKVKKIAKKRKNPLTNETDYNIIAVRKLNLLWLFNFFTERC
ncbi:MAG: hypothetical protein DUD32_01100 [Lactobacillus sp.]|nr:MAG: hypothetical protein DUD32_01100 [Lactobacillus sp.]